MALPFEESEYAFIQNLRRDLTDNYPRNSVLKELLQNGEDARATTVNFGWAPRLPGAEHPLLQGPGFFAVNDGEFTAKDSRAIISYGFNYKSAEGTSIGKYGLGMKGVFHLGEAVFLISSTVAATPEDAPRFNNIINPWAKSNRHADWNDFSAADQGRMREFLGPLCGGEHWFCLWIPLRRSEHSGSHRPITPDTPGNAPTCPKDLLAPGDGEFLAGALPMLRRVRSVRAWDDWRGPESHDQPLFEITIDESSERSRFPDKADLHERRSGAGSIAFRSGSDPRNQWTYALSQWWHSDLEHLRNEDAWPYTFSKDSDSEVKEKALPHCGILMVNRSDRTAGRLTIVQSCFLPLRDPPETLDGFSHPSDVTLYLHGWTFLDAGRARGKPTENHASRSAQEQLRDEWNRRLIHEGTFPSLIPALAELVGGNSALADSLTRAIQSWPTFHNHRTAFCRDLQWIRRWSAGGIHWCLWPATDRVLELPPSEHFETPRRALPNLAELDDVALVYREDPRLTPNDADAWPDAVAARLLEVLDPDPLFSGSGEAFRYYAAFAQLTRGEASLRSLIETLRRIFTSIDIGVGKLREHSETVRKLLGLVPPELRRGIAITGNWKDEARFAVFRAVAFPLLVPAEFEPSVRGTGLIPDSSAIAALQALERFSDPSRNSNPALDLLTAATDRSVVRNGTSTLLLWRSTDAEGKVQLLSLRDLEERRSRGTLFAGDRPEVLRDYCGALSETDLRSVEESTASALFESPLPRCDEAGILQRLGERPKLASSESRLPLFQRLLALSPETPGRVAALRYLIHGDGKVNDSVALFVADGGSGIWGRLLRVTDAGTIVDCPPLLEKLTPEQRTALRLYRVDAAGVAAALQGKDLSAIPFSFTSEERAKILDAWKDFKELLKRLPLHRGTDEEFHRIDHRSYWQGTFAPPRGIEALCQVLVLEEDRVLSAIQSNLAPTLDAARLLEIVSEHPLAGNWKLVAAGFEKIGNALSNKLRTKLGNAEWLPTTEGGFAAPFRVLSHSRYGPAVERVLAGVAAVPGDPIVESRLAPEVRNHTGYAAIARELYARDGGYFQMLGSILVKHDVFAVDAVDWQIPDRVRDWMTAFENAPADVMAVAELARAVSRDDPELLWKHLLPNVRHAVPVERLIGILNHLRGKHASESSGRRAVEQVFNLYLGFFAQDDGFLGASPLLDRIDLLNQEGQWTKPSELCIAAGVARGHQLDTRQAEVLGAHVHVQAPKSPVKAPPKGDPARVASLEPAFVEAADKLFRYFNNWVADEAFGPGTFLALLGDHDPMRRQADEWLEGSRSVEVVRAESGLPEELPDHRRPGTTGKMSRAQRMKKQRFIVEIAPNAKNLNVVNLSGSPQSWPADSTFEHLLVGYEVRPLNVLIEGGLHVHHLQLRRIDDLPPPPRRRELLAKTASILCERVYAAKNADLRGVLEDIAKGELPDVRLAQSEMLDAAGHDLRQFNIAHPDLKLILEAYSKASARKAEEKDAREKRSSLDGESGASLHEAAEERLRTLVVESESARTAILEGVCRKLRESRYQSQSVLFELFQNADDATVERGDATPGPFVVELSERAVRIRHWGRGINSTGQANEPRRDLVKMLSLYHSGKEHTETAPVTGRFGLGFKSVHLVSNSPRLVSGRLHCEILAGFYPRLLGKNVRERLLDADPRATVIELPLKKDCRHADFVDPFREVAAWLPVFARRIRTLRIGTETYEWHPVAILDGIECGVAGGRSALVVHGGRASAVFALGPTGFERVKAIPCCWATAPTMTDFQLGFLLNCGSFLPDTGRVHIDWNAPTNKDILEVFGQELGLRLMTLFDATTEDWAIVRTQLQLAATASPAGFWQSLFDVIVAALPSLPSTLRTAFLETDRGFTKLYGERDSLPTGFGEGPHATLTNLKRVRYELEGYLAPHRVEECSLAMEIGGFAPGEVVAHEVAERFRIEGLERIQLAEVLRRGLGGSLEVTPQAAGQFGRLFSRDLDHFQSDPDEEMKRLKVALGQLRFRAESGQWLPAADLLVDDTATEPDERRRFAFAEPGGRLHAEYGDRGRKFFLACREKMNADLARLVEWARRAETPDQRAGVLRYILEGVYRRFADELQKQHGAWFLQSDTLRRALNPFSVAEQVKIQFALGLLQTAEPPPKAPDAPPPDIFKKIAAWWRRNSEDCTLNYVTRHYPGGRAPLVTDEGPDDEASRMEWLKLFIHGITTTIGRVKPEQNRNFQELCVERGWLKSLADPDEGPERWLHQIEEYIDGQQGESIQWNYWIRHFVNIATVARHLDTYVQCFLDINKLSDRISLPRILSPNQNPDYRGTGLSAPPLGSILGMGACVVLRELIRIGVVRKAPAHPFCWPPKRQLVEFLTRLGFESSNEDLRPEQSRAVHEFMLRAFPENPTFDKHFDIPFLVLTEDPSQVNL